MTDTERRKAIDKAIIAGWCKHSYADPLCEVFASIADEVINAINAADAAAQAERGDE